MEFTRLEEVRAGWSGDRKYHAWDDGGQEFFLRLSPPEKWEKAQSAFALQEKAFQLGLPVSEPIEPVSYTHLDVYKRQAQKAQAAPFSGCPGHAGKTFQRGAAPAAAAGKQESQLGQWPCQIKLVPVKAPYFQGAKLLIAADCTAYAYASFHQDFMRGKITLVGCPKLDSVDYSEKLTEILRENDIQSVTVVRMEVPCCGGLEQAAITALKNSGKFLPWQVVTLSTDGRILD